MLTQDEAELYDRQIRLWGVNAQGRLRQSKVLMLGFNGLASEVAKILTLAGIDTLTIVDDQPLQKSDLTSNLFCRKVSDNQDVKEKFRTHKVKEKLRTLNPLVKVNIDNSPILSKTSNDFKEYDLVTLHTFLKIDKISAINKICRENNVKFYLLLDFGFFGFMFNDLGPEFRYTYEEYDKISEDKKISNEIESKAQTGGEEDPINVDGFEGDDNDDVNEATSDDENRHDSHRPKKRRRHFSPKRDNEQHISKTNEKKNRVDTLSYVTFDDLISFKGASFDKKSSPVMFISIAMIKFFNEHDRIPYCTEYGQSGQDCDENAEKDLSDLNKIIASIKDSLALDDSIFKKLDVEWSSSLGGSISPVCAILGGVAGQDIIRALSNKDIPICNTFSFDGIGMSGIVEKVGMVNKTTTSAVPIVRDYLEID